MPFAPLSSTPSTYIERRLINGAELLRWAMAEGFRHLLRLSDLHATVALARREPDASPFEPEPNELAIEGGERAIMRLDHDVIALTFAAPQLEARRRELERMGCEIRGPYRPHVTFAFEPSVDIGLASAFTGPLTFGPEIVRADEFGVPDR